MLASQLHLWPQWFVLWPLWHTLFTNVLFFYTDYVTHMKSPVFNWETFNAFQCTTFHLEISVAKYMSISHFLWLLFCIFFSTLQWYTMLLFYHIKFNWNTLNLAWKHAKMFMVCLQGAAHLFPLFIWTFLLLAHITSPQFIISVSSVLFLCLVHLFLWSLFNKTINNSG